MVLPYPLELVLMRDIYPSSIAINLYPILPNVRTSIPVWYLPGRSSPKTAVYAHLEHFTPELDNMVNALHQYYGKYTIDHKLEPNDHNVTKGDIIGYSGDTGGVSGPHLHFEIRNADGQPVNPFQYSFRLLPIGVIAPIPVTTTRLFSIFFYCLKWLKR